MSTTVMVMPMSTVSQSIQRSVRFDEECILIPELLPTKKSILNVPSRPRVTTKSFTLPLWPVGGIVNSPTAAGATAKSKEHDLEKDRGRKLTLILPSFTSPGKARPLPSSESLHPCLRSDTATIHYVRQPTQPTSPPVHGPTRPRSKSLPPSTIPLRGCCQACIPIVDAFFACPTTEEIMTKGARRLLHAETHPLADRVMVDEIDIMHGESQVLTHSDTLRDSDLIVEEEVLAGIDVECDDDSELFPLPSPRNSPVPSPSTSQTSLPIPIGIPGSRRMSPLSTCCFHTPVESDQATPLPYCFTEQYQDMELPRLSQSHSPERSEPASPKARRPSLSSIGETFSRGGVAIFKGIAGLAQAGGGGVTSF